jgi:hypothetical protein
LPVLIDDAAALPDAALELVLADHRPDASISANSRSKARPPSLIGRPSAKIPKRPNSAIAGEVEEANYGR